MTKIRWIAWLAVLCAGSLLAQVSAVVSGTVSDPSGAVVPNATVTATNTETGAVRETMADGAGRYQMTPLPVGPYEIHAQKAGFQEAVRRGIQLVVNQSAIVDLTLQVGESSQQITVTEDAPLVGVATTDASGVINQLQVRDLPLNGRSFDLIDHAESRRGQFHLGENRRHRRIELHQREQFRGGRQPAAAESFPAEWHRIHRRGREQHAAGRRQPGTAGRGRGARVQRAARFLRRRVRQTPRRRRFSSSRSRAATNSTDRSTSSCATTTWTRAISSIPVPFPASSAISMAWRWAARSRRTRLSSSAILKDSSSTCTKPASIWFPTTTRATGILPCKLVTPAPSPCPISGLAFVGVSPLINAWPDANAGRAGFRRNLRSFQQSAANHPRRFRHRAPGPHLLPARTPLSAIYTIDDSADFTPTSTNAYSTDVDSLREQVASLEETHVFSPTLLNTARFGYSRAGYFFTGEPTPGTPAADLPGFLAGDPIGALVVGGSAASNPAAQLSLAGSNNGSNLHVARNLFTYEDQVSLTHGPPSIHVSAPGSSACSRTKNWR